MAVRAAVMSVVTVRGVRRRPRRRTGREFVGVVEREVAVVEVGVRMVSWICFSVRPVEVEPRRKVLTRRWVVERRDIR